MDCGQLKDFLRYLYLGGTVLASMSLAQDTVPSYTIFHFTNSIDSTEFKTQLYFWSQI